MMQFIGLFKVALIGSVLSAQAAVEVDNRFAESTDFHMAECQERLRVFSYAGQVNFDEGSNSISAGSEVLLFELMRITTDCAHHGIEIHGHAFEFEDEGRNQRLSIERARVLADYLSNSGLDLRLAVVVGYGSNQPRSAWSKVGANPNNRAGVRLLIDSPVFRRGGLTDRLSIGSLKGPGQ